MADIPKSVDIHHKVDRKNNEFSDYAASFAIHPLIPFLFGIIVGVLLCLVAAHNT